MSETAPRSNPRLENFEANKAATEREKFEDALYGEAGTTDFSEEARKRVEEADEYERHMERLAARANHDPSSAEGARERRTAFIDQLDDLNNQPSRGYNEDLEEAYAEHDRIKAKEEEERAVKEAAAAALDAKIASDPALRQMDRIAAMIAEQRNELVTPENSERGPERLKELEDRLNDLLEKYSETEGFDPEVADELMNRTVREVEASAPADPLDKVENTEDREKIKKIRDFIRDNPDAPETARLVEELKEIMRKINEALNSGDALDDLGDIPVSGDNLDDLDDLPTGSGDNLDDLDDINTPRDPREANYVDKDTALNEAYDEYEAREGSPYDVDKGREKDVEKARELADLEREAMAERTRVKDINEAHDQALEENAELAGTRVEDINEAWDQAHAEDAERTREGKWYRRAWRRFQYAFTPQGRQEMFDRAGDLKDKYKDSKTSTKIAIGVVAATAVTIAAYGAWRAGAFDMFGGDNTPDGTPDVDSGSKGNTPPVDADTSPKTPETPPVVPGADLPPSTGFEYPWDWAVDAFGSEDAMDKLHELADRAAEDGKNVEWHGSGAREWVEINGNSNTKDVIDILRTYNR